LVYAISTRRQSVADELELEGLLFEEDEMQEFLIDNESLDTNDNLSERWASWVNVVNR
jgi:hypothetical protein